MAGGTPSTCPLPVSPRARHQRKLGGLAYRLDGRITVAGQRRILTGFATLRC